MKPKSDKENKANSYTLWEDANAHNISVCGQYISMWDLYQAKLTVTNMIHVNFLVIIGFDDLLPFQNFGDFPACVLGDLKLIIRVCLNALVWCSVDQEQSIKQMCETFPFSKNHTEEIFNYKKAASQIGSNHINHNYDHRFIQVSTHGRAASNCVVDLPEPGDNANICGFRGCDILLKPSAVITYTAQSIITGYKLASWYVEYIRNAYLNEPFVVPAETIFIDNLGANPSTTGIYGTKQFKFNHIKEICVLFPRHLLITQSNSTIHAWKICV
jgi:hypothetical protein